MERERREISYCSHHLSLARCTKGMGSITTDSYTAYHLLQVCLRSKDILLAFHNTIQSVVVARDTSQVHRNNRLSIRSDGLLHSLIVHLQAILLHIDKDKRSPNMLHHRSTCRVGIGRHYHLVTFAYAQQPQRHFGTSRLRVQAYRLVHTHKFGYTSLASASVISGGEKGTLRNFIVII